MEILLRTLFKYIRCMYSVLEQSSDEWCNEFRLLWLKLFVSFVDWQYIRFVTDYLFEKDWWEGHRCHQQGPGPEFKYCNNQERYIWWCNQKDIHAKRGHYQQYKS